MKKSFYLLLLATIISAGAKAQDTKPNLEYRLYPGTITTTDGQTIAGYVYNQDNGQNQNKCIFYTDANDGRSKKVYKPADLQGYSVENFRYKSLNYSGNIGIGKGDRSFLFIAKPGAISTLLYFINHEEQPVWQKGD